MMKKIVVNNKLFVRYIKYKSIKLRVKEIAAQINSEYEHKDPVFVPVLNGSFMFSADLLKEVNIHSHVSFVKFTSYSGTASTGKVSSLIGLDSSIRGRHIIIVEDIIDTGLTMHELLKEVKKLKPASIKIATLLLKRAALKKNIEPDFIGFEIEHKFVVGYGLDYDGYGRNLKHIYEEWF
jgi:hypoxanthine phosphoribosyltransferase